jgi:hypothetical protein
MVALEQGYSNGYQAVNDARRFAIEPAAGLALRNRAAC